MIEEKVNIKNFGKLIPLCKNPMCFTSKKQTNIIFFLIFEDINLLYISVVKCSSLIY